MSSFCWKSAVRRAGRLLQSSKISALVVATAVSVGLFVSHSGPTRAAGSGYKRAMTTLRLLSYDRNVGQRISGEPVFAVVSPKGNPPEDVESMEKALARTSSNFDIDGERISIRRVTYRSADQFKSKLDDIDPAAAYVAGALTDNIDAIIERTRQHSVLTFVPTRSMVENGAGVAVVSKSRGYRLIINLPAVRAEGVDFPARILKIADEVLR